ncbi:MAG: hypothetical protein JW810_07490 [Sedimentisphaerales bacterium]|nr:hypothetical protein [Sedimentisphaerales bacterium]
MDSTQKSTLLITCAPGLAGYLRGEVEALGYPVDSEHAAGLELQGDLLDAMKLNLHLRTAYNVLFLLAHFPCASPEQLYRQVVQLPWERIISPDKYLSVVGRIDTPSIDNTMYPSLKVKDAITDRIMRQTGARPDSGKQKHQVVVQLYWKQDRCWLYLNTSGQKISDRTYRKIPHKAPLRESLAAAIVMATGYDGGCPLLCPMCGSGTLAIEAALIACRRPPGLLRSNFGFMHLNYFDPAAWQRLRAEALKLSKKRGGKAVYQPARIVASDLDPEAVEAARQNARTAGVDHLIDFAVCDFADSPVEPGGGIILLNPEYGQRLGQIARLEETYKRIGDFFKQRCAGYTAYLFTGNMELAKKVGLRTSRRLPFFNAQIECRLLRYELYRGTRKHKSSEGVESEQEEGPNPGL